MSARTVRAPAKVNLHLGVGAPQEDGYHPLVTVYQAVGICDDLTVRPHDGWSVEMTVPDWMTRSPLPAVEDNIVTRAARLLAEHHGIAPTGAVEVVKAIPVAGGMAGGSADAAAALVALDRLWDVRTPDEDLLAIAARLGSDVPFALLGGTALGTGRGELVDPLGDPATWWWVVAPAAHGLSTPTVYQHFDVLRTDAPAEPPPADELVAAMWSRDPRRLAAALHNDLQPAAVDLRPELGELIARGEDAGALRGIVSGSGPTCVFLAGSSDTARAVAAELARDDEPPVLVTHGPVAGAHLVEYGRV